MHDAVLLIPIVAIMTGGALLFPVVRALARRMEPHGAADLEELRAEVEYCRGRLEAAEGMATRLAELEERLDFTERLLAQQRPGPLPGG